MDRHLRPYMPVVIMALLIGSTGAAAIWTLLSLRFDSQLAFAAPVVAFDLILLLRLVRVRRGRLRAGLVLIGTLLAIALANWWIAASQIGRMFGFMPWEAIPRTGLHYAWTLAQMANGVAELAWYGLAVAIALLSARWP